MKGLGEHGDRSGVKHEVGLRGLGEHSDRSGVKHEVGLRGLGENAMIGQARGTRLA